MGAGSLFVRGEQRRRSGKTPVRPVLHQEPVVRTGSAHHRRDNQDGRPSERHVMSAGVAVREAVADSIIPLSDFGIADFGDAWFAENRTSSHHVAMRLARRTRVLYVDSPGLRAPKATGRDLRKLGRKLLMSEAKPRQIADQMWHITMPQVPFRRLPAVADLNRAAGRFIVRRAMKHLGFDRTITWRSEERR